MIKARKYKKSNPYHKGVDENVDFQDLVSTNIDVNKLLSSSDIDTLFDHNQYLVHLDEIFDRLGF